MTAETPAGETGMQRVATLLAMIKFSHSIFALPFCLLTLFVAAGGLPPARVVLWSIVAMVGARTAAMSFNRVVDAAIDARNPRTARRALPQQIVSRWEALLLTAAGAAAFLLAAAALNRIALLYAIPVLVVLLGYSTAKRWTDLSHFILGLSLGIAPLGAWVAVKGEHYLDAPLFPILMSGAVLLWTAGFDVIYACQDAGFDRQTGLRSLPARLGVGPSLRLSLVLHLLAVALFTIAGWVASLSYLYFVGVAAVASLLAYGQIVVKENDLSRIDVAFFTVNGWVSMTLMVLTLCDIWVFG